MKKFKRLLLRPFYAIYWLLVFEKNRVTFNQWLIKRGFWRLSNALDNLKLLVPKSYIEFVKKYPDFKPYYPELRVSDAPKENKFFYHYEARKQDER